MTLDDILTPRLGQALRPNIWDAVALILVIGAMVLNAFMNIGVLGILIAAGIGAIGVIALISSTSAILQSGDSVDASAGSSRSRAWRLTNRIVSGVASAMGSACRSSGKVSKPWSSFASSPRKGAMPCRAI